MFETDNVYNSVYMCVQNIILGTHIYTTEVKKYNLVDVIKYKSIKSIKYKVKTYTDEEKSKIKCQTKF